MSDLSSRITKKENSTFSVDDLGPVAQRQVRSDAPIFVLPEGVWVKIEGKWFLNKGISGNMDDAWAEILVAEDKPSLNWILLPIKKAKEVGEFIMWGNSIPNTNVVLDIWYVGDGTEGVVLVAPLK